MTNVLYGLSRLALGQPSLTPAIVERMYDEDSGLFWPLSRPAPTRRPPLTWTALSPLALPDLPEQIGRRLVEEHLLDSEPLLAALPGAVGGRDRAERSRSSDTEFPGSSATGAGRPGSTPRGSCGSAWCGSATTTRRRSSRAG